MKFEVNVNVLADGMDESTVVREIAQAIHFVVNTRVNGVLRQRFGSRLQIDNVRVTNDTGFTK